MSFIFNRAKPERCLLCKQFRGNHKAGTLNCPMGKRTRAGWTTYNTNQVYDSPSRSAAEQEGK